MSDKTGALAVRQRSGLGLFSLEGEFGEVVQRAKYLTRSTMVPDAYRCTNKQNEDQALANVLIAMDYAARVGVPPLEVMQNLHVIHGRPSWGAPYLIGLINSSGKFDGDLVFEFVNPPPTSTPDVAKDTTFDEWGCRAKALKDGQPVVGTTITIGMARKSGWLTRNSSKWPEIPEQMLIYRAAAFFSRAHCPEVTFGMHTQDELDDAPIDVTEVEVMDPPPPAATVAPEKEPERPKRQTRGKKNGAETPPAEEKPKEPEATTQAPAAPPAEEEKPKEPEVETPQEAQPPPPPPPPDDPPPPLDGDHGAFFDSPDDPSDGIGAEIGGTPAGAGGLRDESQNEL